MQARAVGKHLYLLLLKLAVNSLAMLAVSRLVSGIRFDQLSAVVAAALVLALINAYLRPLILLLTLPINVLTLGLFTLVINAILLQLTSHLIPGFHVDTFWSALFGAVGISIVSFLLNWFFRPPPARITIVR